MNDRFMRPARVCIYKPNGDCVAVATVPLGYDPEGYAKTLMKRYPADYTYVILD